jgi:glycosyltransferase involved in cell wall biosynthesis
MLDALMPNTSVSIYPAADFDSFTPPDWEKKSKSRGNTFVSLNRFERKKNVGLAIEALGVLQNKLLPEKMTGVRLVVAGTTTKTRIHDFVTSLLLTVKNHEMFGL